MTGAVVGPSGIFRGRLCERVVQGQNVWCDDAQWRPIAPGEDSIFMALDSGCAGDEIRIHHAAPVPASRDMDDTDKLGEDEHHVESMAATIASGMLAGGIQDGIEEIAKTAVRIARAICRVVQG